MNKKNHIDLTKSDLPNQEDKLFEIIEKFTKQNPGTIILAQGNEKESFVLAKIIPSQRKDKTLIFPEPNPVTIY